MKREFKKPITRTLIICAAIELLLFIQLCSFDRIAFNHFFGASDTSSYKAVAWTLVHTGTLIPSERTLGYPLFLALGFLIGGPTYGFRLVLAGQLLLNLLFTWGCWKLLKELTPDVRTGLRIAATLFFFWAGLGMALLLLSDFLASFFFGVFLYGMLFWRSRLSGLFSGTFLALATLTRPTFTFVPLLLPIAAYLVRRVTSRLPWVNLASLVGFSLAATAISISYQYYSFGYLGPSNVVTKNIARTLHYASTDREMTSRDYQAFSERIAKEANGSRPLSQSEEEQYGKKILLDALKSQPEVILFQLGSTLMKSIFVPVESQWEKLFSFYGNGRIYESYVRPFLLLVCLPLWVLALIPPSGSTEPKRVYYYLLMLLFLFYITGLSAINPAQGERIRFPVLPFMLPVILWNACDLRRLYRMPVNRLRSDARPVNLPSD